MRKISHLYKVPGAGKNNMRDSLSISMNPMHRTRDLLPGNGDLRAEQDRKMGFCVIKKIRRRYQKRIASCSADCRPHKPVYRCDRPAGH